jgi:hypothetical protein
MLGLVCFAVSMAVSARADPCAPWSDTLVIDGTDLPACVQAAPAPGDSGAVEVTNSCAEPLRIAGPAAGCPDCDAPLDLAPDQTGVFTVSYASTPTEADTTSVTLAWSTQTSSGYIQVTVTHARGGCGADDESGSSGCALAPGSTGAGWWVPLVLAVGALRPRRRRSR